MEQLIREQVDEQRRILLLGEFSDATFKQLQDFCKRYDVLHIVERKDPIFKKTAVEDLLKALNDNVSKLETTTKSVKEAVEELLWFADLPSKTISLHMFKKVVEEKLGILIDIDPTRQWYQYPAKFVQFASDKHEQAAKERQLHALVQQEQAKRKRASKTLAKIAKRNKQ